MRINVNAAIPPNPADPTQGLGNASASGQTTQAAKQGFRNAGSDQVRISDLAAQLASDPGKLAQLQAAYSAGTYQVSPSQIANSIVNAHLVKGQKGGGGCALGTLVNRCLRLLKSGRDPVTIVRGSE
jgi:anti-sigma28 factor (negative regulator of flagellin synthesis)